jgi:ethanolamine-phosphate cytidylyltransferase
MNERVLNLLSLKDVDDIILSAPYFITESFIKDFNISAVIEGKVKKPKVEAGDDPFEVPKHLGIYHEVDSGTDFSINNLISRVQEHHKAIEEAIEKKKAKQDVYYEFDSKREKKVVEIQ